ncbi:MAG TPA: APC family permease [Candidatus Angelobacter sp.]|nr:APC family permease [Candidatus Angelobacter sp.]
MSQLARKLRTIDYFTLGFGTMVGVGWLVLMDDWLQRGGPWGGILGFLLGGVLLLPIGYVYGKLVMAIPDAGGEIAYAAKVFPPSVGFFSGWMMMLAYLVVCPWEGVAIGSLTAYIFPELNRGELYRIAGQPVFLPHLAIGLGLTALITYVNFRGIRISAAFQNWTTFGLLALFAVFASCGLAKGEMHNTLPPFSQGAAVSILLVLQIVPYFMTGFESVAKCAEEANPAFRARGFFRAIVAALLVGVGFYALILFVVSYAWPWQELEHRPFATIYALEHALGARWVVNIVLIAALLSLLKIFNGNFLASSRLLFALGRRQMVNGRVAYIHEKNQTPVVSILAIGALTSVGVCMGKAILVPVTEVGSLACACGWLSACAAYFCIEASATQRLIAFIGAMVSVALIAMKLLWFVPGHFSLAEWIALAVWIGVGLLVRGQATVRVATRAALQEQ